MPTRCKRVSVATLIMRSPGTVERSVTVLEFSRSKQTCFPGNLGGNANSRDFFNYASDSDDIVAYTTP